VSCHIPSCGGASRPRSRGERSHLRLAGNTYSEIATTAGYSSASSAHRAVKAELDALPRENAEAVRTMELARLDAMLSALDDKIEAGDTKAIGTALRIMDRRAKYLGLDGPIKIDMRQRIIDEAHRLGLDEAEMLAAAEEILREGTWD